jgi:hypothetical protein
MLELAQEYGGDLLECTEIAEKRILVKGSLEIRSLSTKVIQIIRLTKNSSNRRVYGIKRRRILSRFKKYQLILVAKCT